MPMNLRPFWTQAWPVDPLPENGLDSGVIEEGSDQVTKYTYNNLSQIDTVTRVNADEHASLAPRWHFFNGPAVPYCPFPSCHSPIANRKSPLTPPKPPDRTNFTFFRSPFVF